ncbi:hypothetical protein [Iodobacter fluviatilis]|uniref:Uncharacterized protein n=1 Tax=Iodobacter fluviatilis TaxID=537 RepID=A0A377Q488_9NEIS|nr:hypothetical protein [Iodobacter fluviatilis]TCU90503.1 hypothetical protein EV682_101536 [Iodobacter fluviatilis]STQ89530.1 Uncharacterised protein [Iodobacter fluviatilis]
MENLVHALIIACKHINASTSTDPDKDIEVLESIAAELHNLSSIEKELLIDVAKKLGMENWLNEIGLL